LGRPAEVLHGEEKRAFGVKKEADLAAVVVLSCG
jgi:hypothetical protein